MDASDSSLPRKCSPCLFIHHHHHHRHCHLRHHMHHCHGRHVHHHHHPFHYHQYFRQNPESLPDASPGMTLEQDHGFQLQPPPEEEEDEEPIFVMTDEWKEFFAKSEAKRRSERKKAKNKGRNTDEG